MEGSAGTHEPPGAVDDRSEFLGSVALFGGLDAASLVELARRAEPVHVGRGEVVIRQSEPADCLFVVRSGRLAVRTRDGDGAERTLGHVGRGEVVGEMALVSEEPRSADVVAERDSELVRVGTDLFDDLAAANPHVLRRVAGEVVRRVRASRDGVSTASSVSTVAVVAVQRHGDAADVAARLLSRLAGVVPGATVVTRQRAEGVAEGVAGGGHGADRAAWERVVARWVAELEQSHPVVVFDCTDGEEHEWSEWTRWCVRHADVVLPVVDVRSGSPGRADDAGLGAATMARSEVVLARPRWMQDARGTAALVAALGAARHHHAREGCDDDAARVARLVTGRPVTLVLSGGGARGIAHIGVVRAVQELGIPVDAVGGSSIGSLVGGAVARGWGWERISRSIREGLTGGRGVMDPTFPVLSLTAGRRLTRRLRDGADGLEVEDLLLDYHCVSTNLTRNAAKVHRSGPVWKAVRASLAIPGLFPPVPDGEDVLVDGGLLENFPVARMRERLPGASVVGVDVGSRRDFLAVGVPTTCESPALEGLRVLLGLRRREGSVTMARVLARLTELGVGEPGPADRPEVTVAPPVQDLPILDFERFDELEARGYRHGLEVLGPWAAAERGSGAGW